MGKKGLELKVRLDIWGLLKLESETSEDQGRGPRKPWHRHRCGTGAPLWAALYLGEVPSPDKVQRPLTGVDDKRYDVL